MGSVSAGKYAGNFLQMSSRKKAIKGSHYLYPNKEIRDTEKTELIIMSTYVVLQAIHIYCGLV